MEKNTKKTIFSLDGKIMVITGSSGLIGRELVGSCIELGATVIGLDLNNNDKKMTSSDKDNNRRDFDCCDITCQSSVGKSVSRIIEKYGRIDVLVNNAYPRNESYGRSFEEITLKDWNENVDMHLGGYFNVSQQVAKKMRESGGGSIINIGSIYGVVGPNFNIYEGTDMTMPAEYSAVKGGIINFTRYLATYLARLNIRVNTISPGGIFNDQNDKFVEQYKKKVPLGRMGRPEDISGAVAFLASDASNYITGQNIIVDGGWTAW